MMSETIAGVVIGAELAVFTALLTFIYVAQDSDPELDLRPFYVMAGAFIGTAFIHSLYVMSIVEGSLRVLTMFSDFATVEAVSQVLVSIAGLAAIYFLHGYKVAIREG